MIEVLQPGFLTTIQDSGRRGYEAYGMPGSGPFDPFLASVANRLVGNDLNAPLLEFALTGPSLKFDHECWIAIVANSAEYLLDQELVPEFSAVPVHSDSVLQFRGMRGWFGYLAVAGGFVAPPVLGSVSTYLAGKLGRRLEAGASLQSGTPGHSAYRIPKESLGLRTTNIVPILPGLHTGQFSARNRLLLAESEYRIASHSNRMGIHMRGVEIGAPAVKRSAPVLRGTIQIPRTGQPIILGPEGPTTGGYPQIGILSRISWTKLAETRPGECIRFEWMDVDKARQLWEYRNSIFQLEEAWQRI